MLPVPQEKELAYEKEPQTESIPPTVEVDASSSQPTPHDPPISEKDKTPATEESEADDEETEDELDPSLFCFARRRPGLSTSHFRYSRVICTSY